MKVVSYNCFEGAHETREVLDASIRQLDPDVVQLQEINGWGDGNPSSFVQFASSEGYPTAIFGDSNTRFNLGTLARCVPVRSEVLTEGFWHSTIHTELPFEGEVLHLWNVHLNPRNEDDRLLEVNTIIARIGKGSLSLVTGDFNSLARRDSYPPELVHMFNGLGLTKFGDKELRFDVIDRMLEAGLVDIGAQYPWQNTVPTPANSDFAHAATLRLDYAFASPRLAERVSGYRVVKDELTDNASDHYPVEVIIDED